jgi:hypothetical protein
MRSNTIGAALLVWCALGGAIFAQGGPTPPDDLRRQVERRFEVVVVRDGLVLRANPPGRGARTIEVLGGQIIVDGAPATGAELRDKLGDDSSLVLQLSYLDAAQQRALFAEPQQNAAPSPPPPPALPDLEPPDRPERARGRQSSDRIRFGGGITVNEDEYIRGDVVAIGGSARVFGEVRGNVVAIGGSAELGPKAAVHGDVTVIGGPLKRDPAARIDGETHEIGVGGIGAGDWQFSFPSLAALWWGWTLGAVHSLIASIVRVAVLCLLAALVMLVARDYVERISVLAAAEPFKAGAIGFLAQVFFVPVLVITILLLIVTIIGIPLLVLIPFAILGLGIIGLVGFTAVSYHLGRLVCPRVGWTEPGPFGTAIAGILLVVSPILLARLIGLGGGVLYPMTIGLGIVGVLVEYVAWTVGFGAVALARFGRGPAGVMPAGQVQAG